MLWPNARREGGKEAAGPIPDYIGEGGGMMERGKSRRPLLKHKIEREKWGGLGEMSKVANEFEAKNYEGMVQRLDYQNSKSGYGHIWP
jgi:hypothetical protein